MADPKKPCRWTLPPRGFARILTVDHSRVPSGSTEITLQNMRDEPVTLEIHLVNDTNEEKEFDLRVERRDWAS